MFILDFKYLTKFVTVGVLALTVSGIGVFGAEQLLVRNVEYAKASGPRGIFPVIAPSKYNCSPDIQKIKVKEKIKFKAKGDNPIGWYAPGSDHPEWKGKGTFEISYKAKGNYRVWSDDNDRSCFITVYDPDHDYHPAPTHTPTPTPYIVHKYNPDDHKDRPHDYPLVDNNPCKIINGHNTCYKTSMPTYHTNPAPHSSNPHHQEPKHNDPEPETSCPEGWSKQVNGVATVCLPGAQVNQNQEQTQNQNQNNNQTQNVNTNVVATGGSSSSSSSSSSSNSVSININD